MSGSSSYQRSTTYCSPAAQAHVHAETVTRLLQLHSTVTASGVKEKRREEERDQRNEGSCSS